VLLLLCLLFSRLQVPKSKDTTPVVFSGPVKAGRCRIPVELGGKSYLFLVDTGIEQSYLRPDVKVAILKQDKKAVLGLGGGSIPIDAIAAQESSVYQEFPPIGGIIGMDILSKVAFSIDYNKQEVSIWPAAATEADIELGVFADEHKSSTIPLISEPGYQSMFLQTSLGEAELDTGAVVSLLAKTASKSPEVLPTTLTRPMELFDGKAGKATQVVVRQIRLGDDNVFCQPMLLSDTTDVSVISANLFGRKILFDFPHKKLEYAIPSDTERACNAIGALLHGTVEARKSELFLKAQLARNLGATKDPWVRIASIDGRKGSEWLAMFQRRDPAVALALQRAYDSLSKSGKVMVEHDGKQEALYLAPYLNP
jgi:hypothetical protein